tara:strand:+ start:2790 stop:3344 length:555 start_codon:yes stop_codon:yes gene_type:complete
MPSVLTAADHVLEKDLHVVDGAFKKLTRTARMALTVASGATHDLIINQPAFSVLEDLTVMIVDNADVVCASAGTMDLSIGTAAGGGQIVAASSICGRGTGSESGKTLAHHIPYKIISDGLGVAQDGLKTRYGQSNPTHNEAVALVGGATHSETARDLYVRLTNVGATIGTTPEMLVQATFRHIL